MAIKLSKTDIKGVITRYHRLVDFSVYPDKINAVVESYVNDKVRKSADGADGEVFYSRTDVVLPYDGEDKLCFECVYERLLQSDEFRGGEKI